MCLYVLTILLNSCVGATVSERVLTASNDTVWDVKVVNHVTQKVLKLNGKVVEELYYSDGKVDSFRVYDELCGEYRELSGGSGDTIKYMGCAYTEDVLGLKTIDSVYSFYLPQQKSKDSFDVTLWVPIEENKKYTYEIYRGATAVLKISKNFPVIRIKLPYSSGKEENIYYLRKTIQYANGVCITKPLVLFKGIDH